MENIEQIELERHRNAIERDLIKLIEKYRAIFGWDVPDVDERKAEKLILREMHRALDTIELKSAT